MRKVNRLLLEMADLFIIQEGKKYNIKSRYPFIKDQIDEETLINIIKEYNGKVVIQST